MSDLTVTFRQYFPSSSFRASGLIAAFAFLICLFAAESAQAQLTLTVTRTDDRNATCDSGVDCSLREAVNAANTAPSNDMINFAIPAGDPNCPSGVCTITLTVGELAITSAATAGTLTITNSTGASNLLISGSNTSRVLYLNSGANLTTDGVTITNGNGRGTTNTSVNNSGGGIYNNRGILALTNSIVSGNTASNGGGGIFTTAGTLTYTNSIVRGNTTGGRGGGISNGGSGPSTYTNSIVSDNRAGDAGGGIYNASGTMTFTNSTASGNTANNLGGGVYLNLGTLTFTNSTISGNTAGSNTSSGVGGGIYIYTGLGATTLTNSTVSGNTAYYGGGIFNNNQTLNLTSVTVTRNNSTGASCDNTCAGGITSSGTANLKNTIVAGNTAANASAPPDYRGPISAASAYNLIGNGQGTTGITDGVNSNQVGTPANPIDPKLAPLANNGGTTQTHALLFGSPALDTGNSFGLTTDQRGAGFARPVDLPSVPNGSGDFADIGAFEAQTAPQAMADLAVSISDSPDPVMAGAVLTYTINLTNNGPDAADTTSFTGNIPANTTFVSFTQNTGSPFDCTTPDAGVTGTVTCSIASLASGASAQFTLVVYVNATTPAGTVISNTVSASTTSSDPTSGNNTAMTTTTVVIPSPLTLTVTRTDDRNATCVTGDCSLREAINAANAAATNDTINFAIPAGDPNCPSGVCTITLTLGELAITSEETAGTLLITNSTGASNLLISGNNASRVFYLNFSANLTISGVTITKGNGTGTSPSGSGGGIFNDGGILTLTNSIVSGNTASGSGGGIRNGGILTLTNSTVSGNTTTTDGGGLYNVDTLNLTNSTVSGNTASGSGGGIRNESESTTTLTNSTASGNMAGDGGGISNNGTINLTSVTVTRNKSTDASCTTCAGGIANFGIANLKNTIVAVNTVANAASSPDFRGSVAEGSAYNLIGNGQGTTGIANDDGNANRVGVDPRLGALANNGGATQTHALLFGSPALDKGNSFGLTTDQRGFLRPVDLPSVSNGSGDFADIGAFEAQTAPAAPTAASVSLSGRVMTSSGRGIVNVRLSLTDSSGQVRTATTTSFGYYHFEDVQAGETYIISARGKHYSFSQPLQVLSVNEEAKEVNFIAN